MPRLLALLCGTLLTAGLLFSGNAAPAAAQQVRMAVTDVVGLEDLQREFGAFGEKLSELTGLEVDFMPVSNRTAAVEAMDAGQVDFVLTGPAEYIVFRARSNAETVVGWQRPDYFAQVVTASDSGIRTVDDLKGKKVSFGAIGSTSQHLGPAQALADLGLTYGEDYEPVILARNVAVEALLRGDIAAIGMNFDHLNRIRAAYPDVGFAVVARGRDLPSDILIAAPAVPEETVETVREAFLEHGKELLAAALKGEDNQKYAGGVFQARVVDADYDYVRSMYRTIGVDGFGEFVGD